MRNLFVIVLLLIGSVGISEAAQQCFIQAGTYGSLTVTENGTSCGRLGFARYAITDWAVIANSSCNFNISPSVSGASVKVQLGNINPGEVVSFALNDDPYLVQASDIDNVATPPTPAGTLYLIGNDVGGNASGGDNGGNGTISFGNAPSLISTVNITQSASPGLGALLVVCVDEPTTAALPAAPVPTLNWPHKALLVIFLLGFVYYYRRRVLAGQRG